MDAKNAATMEAMDEDEVLTEEDQCLFLDMYFHLCPNN